MGGASQSHSIAPMDARPQSLGEEIANSLIHGIALLRYAK
jgi:hypothetical protein